MLLQIHLHTTPYYILYKGETEKNENKKSSIKDIIIISDNELQNQIHTPPPTNSFTIYTNQTTK